MRPAAYQCNVAKSMVCVSTLLIDPWWHPTRNGGISIYVAALVFRRWQTNFLGHMLNVTSMVTNLISLLNALFIDRAGQVP